MTGKILQYLAIATTACMAAHASSRTDLLGALNHVPIEFYGRAVDQTGAPVTGAAVTATVLYNTGTTSGIKKIGTTTGAEGYFQFTGLMGQELGIEITKPWYDYHPRQSSFAYSHLAPEGKRHVADPARPVVLVLWKKQPTEPLIHYDIDRDVPADGTPVRINLETGRRDNDDPDLIIAVSRSPLVLDFGARGYAWSATVDVLHGGLIRAGARDYYNVAPASGYTPHFEYSQAPQDVQTTSDTHARWTWTESFSDTFFISTRDGKAFARVFLRIMGDADRKRGDNIGAVRTTVWLNPNGSRNLEFDPEKAITPK